MAPDRCRLLEWDSAHFGFPVARVNDSELTPESADEIERWCSERDVRCLYLLVGAGDAGSARVAAEHGYFAVDFRLQIRHRLDGLDAAAAPDSQALFRAAEASDLAALQPIARAAHRDTRFYFDTHFPEGPVGEMYAAWLERGLTDPKRSMRVAELEGEPVAYEVIRLPEAEGGCSLELLAVAEPARGRGMAQGLLLDSLVYLRELGAESVPTVLQARNIASIRLHELIGFLPESVGVWHHRWFE